MNFVLSAEQSAGVAGASEPNGSVWAKVSARTAEMRAEGERILAQRAQEAETAPTKAVTRRPEELVPLIRKELAKGAEHYRAAGALLLEAKKGLKHGEWLPWLKDNFALTARSAQLYIAAAKTKRISHLAGAATRRNERRAPEREPQPPRVVDHCDPVVERHKALFIEMAQAGFKRLAFERHPDRGGSAEAMAALSAARDWGVEFIEHPPLINLHAQ